MEISGHALPAEARLVVLVVRAVLDFLLFVDEVQLVVNVFVARLLLTLWHVFAQQFAMLYYVLYNLVLLAIWTLKPRHDGVMVAVSVGDI